MTAAQRTPPDTAIVAAWIFGAFVSLFCAVFGFCVLIWIVGSLNFHEPPPAVTAQNTSPNMPPPVVVQPMQPVRPMQPVQPIEPVRPVQPMQPVRPVQPVAPPPHMTFSDIDDAIKYAQSGQAMERRAAVSYLEDAASKPESHDKIMAAARVLYNEEAYRSAAVNMIKSAAKKEDLPVLREMFATMVQSGVGSSAAGSKSVQTMIELLSGFEDVKSGPQYVECMKVASLRDAAGAALAGMGSLAEELIQPLALSDDRDIATRGLKMLAEVGTARSILTFHKAIYLKAGQGDLPATAEAQLKALGERLKLKPEEYLYAVSDHYAFTPPSGFKADTTFVQANAHQWTRTAPNRSVKSVMTVSVKIVPANYTINAVEGLTQEVGDLKFVGVEQPVSTNIIQQAHYQAVDGEYLIDVKLTLDRADAAAASSLNAALQSIKAK